MKNGKQSVPTIRLEIPIEQASLGDPNDPWLASQVRVGVRLTLHRGARELRHSYRMFLRLHVHKV